MTYNNDRHILTINSGSSSIKFSLYQMENPEPIILKGEIEGIGHCESYFYAKNGAGKNLTEQRLAIPNHGEALKALFEWFKGNKYDRNVGSVGHRIVHGGIKYWEPQMINPDLIEELGKLSPFTPEHLPGQLEAVEMVGRFFPGIKQVACFDTAFHCGMPGVARLYGLPRYLSDQGVLRYGFHGLSYEYIVEKLRGVAGEDAARGRIVIAHLGHGSSMVAVKNGSAVDTTMGFTPAGGLVMSTRSGDLDPGVMIYLLKEKGMSPEGLNMMINRQSGILGVSGITDDIKELLAREESDGRAREAVELFCYQAKKAIGSLAAVLGGLDTLIFTAGIGENAWQIRRLICVGMGFLGIRIDPQSNRANAPVISLSEAPVVVRVIRTNEELMIAKHTYRLITEGE